MSEPLLAMDLKGAFQSFNKKLHLAVVHAI
jgi:hypothetical protein